VSRAGRWTVLVAALLATAVLATELTGGASLFAALAKAAGAAIATMAATGIALRLWTGAAVAGVQLPGGAGMQLEPSDEIDALRGDLRRQGLRTDARLRRLEREVLGENGGGGRIQ
jgi:hypothetical protein